MLNYQRVNQWKWWFEQTNGSLTDLRCFSWPNDVQNPVDPSWPHGIQQIHHGKRSKNSTLNWLEMIWNDVHDWYGFFFASGWEPGISSAKVYRFAEGNSVISKQIWLTMGADKQQWWAQLENSRVCGACEQQNLSVDEFEAKQNMHPNAILRVRWLILSQYMLVFISHGIPWIFPSSRSPHSGRGKAVWPPGRFSALSGFVELGESLEECVVREVREESGEGGGPGVGYGWWVGGGLVG